MQHDAEPSSAEGEPRVTKKLLMGNEAFAHAALEAGVSVVAGYPGTPSSELVETVARLQGSGRAQGVHVEWSTNEKAALEVCAAAAMSGARALFTCKQVGLNVASDALLSLNYVGIRGGLVLFVADDPGPISSQTEQDTRRFAAFAKVPVFDPATPEQGFAMMKAAFELSEEYGTPVIVRPTTRINHASTFFDVEDTTAARPLAGGGFKHDADRWVIFPKRSFEAHGQINDRLNSMTRIFSLDPHYAQFFPSFEKVGQSAPGVMGEAPYLGIVCGGVSTQYAREALEMLERLTERAGGAAAGAKIPPYRFMQMGIAYPFNNRVARRFMNGLSHVLVLEELDSTLEESLMVAASGGFLSAHIHGRLTGEAPTRGENSTENMAYAIAHFFDEYTKVPVPTPVVRPEPNEATNTNDANDAKAAEPKEAKRGSTTHERRGAHRLPDHVREEQPESERRIGLIGVAAELQAYQPETPAPERVAQRHAQSAASRRQAQSAARRRQAHAARYRSPASKALASDLEATGGAAAGAAGASSASAEAVSVPITPEVPRVSLVSLVDTQLGADALLHYQGTLPPRPPVLCAGCPHRGAFYAVKGALDKMGVRRDDAILCGDIGCYTLGNALPLAAVDTCLCMGAGITMAQGFATVEPGRKQVAFVGDSTFFASGMTGIVNAVYNGHDITIAVLDNATTAMTGSQPHPGTGITLMGERRDPIRIDAMLEAMGVDLILYADPLDRTQAEEMTTRALRHAGPSAVIFQSPCIWMKPFGIPAEVDPEVCTGCKRCITDIGCPAIAFNPDARGRKSGLRGQAVIDPSLCNGCGLCTQVCPFGAIGVPTMLDYAARDQGSVRVGSGTARNLTNTRKTATELLADERSSIEEVGDTLPPAETEPEPDEASDTATASDAVKPSTGNTGGANQASDADTAEAKTTTGPPAQAGTDADADVDDRSSEQEPAQQPSGTIRNKEVGSVELDPLALFGGALTVNIGGTSDASDANAGGEDANG